jgi:hypothetical protein
MDTMLLVVTVASLVVAAASASVAWRVTRAERHRQAARVAALATAAGVTRPLAGAPALAFVETPATVAAASPDISDAVGVAGVAGGLFGSPSIVTGSAGRQQWLMGAAGVFAAVVVAFAGIGFLGSRAVGTVTAPQRLPLELVALSHNRAEGALAVAGLVRNPDGGAQVDELEAEVRVFDAAGILIATRSARVALVEPGQEASFAVSLGEIATAARYRVSFHAAGAIVPHVDRRTNLPSAVTAEAR